ncbi:MAG TPA: hypothetical protein VFY96_14120 [Candidatus Binatia bacterium]|nr:hypothetical protein [Candidatus Binatia bacterium]
MIEHTVGWGQTDAQANWRKAPKREGKLIWYTSTNVTESKPFLYDFEKQYPFIKGEICRASGEKTLNRIITEARAGRSEFDIVPISEVDALIEAKILAPYRSQVKPKNLDFAVGKKTDMLRYGSA